MVFVPDVGDTATLSLTVDPADGTTTATVQATSPTGTISNPATTPNADRTVWTAPLLLTTAGAWPIVWTVTGTGAGVQHDTVYALTTPPTGEAYATLTDLATYLGATPPAGSEHRLIRATTVLDELLIGARYPVNSSGLPTQAAHSAALRDAACAQVQWWVELGDVTGVGISTWWDPMSTESTSPSRRNGGDSTGDRSRPTVAPAAISILRSAGFFPIRAVLYG